MMIVLSGHFKTLIFYEIFDVLSSKSYGDHCRSLYINTFPFGRVLSPIDRYFDRFELTQLVLQKYRCLSVQFNHNYNYIPGIKETGIVCFRFHHVCSFLFHHICQRLPIITTMYNTCVYPQHCFKILQLFKPLT